MYDEHILNKTQRCKDKHLIVQVEIMNIDSLHPADLKSAGSIFWSD